MNKSILSVYSHKRNKENPGSVWTERNVFPVLNPHICLTPKLIENRFDIAIRFMYAKHFLLNKEEQEKKMWGRLYEKMQNKRIQYSNIDAFEKLIVSVAKEGIQNPIPVSQSYGILDGSHRLATAFALDIIPRVQIFNATAHTYPREWFLNNFTEKEIVRIDDAYSELSKNFLLNNYQTIAPLIIWPVAIPMWDEIIQIFVSKNILESAFQVVFPSSEKFELFIKDTYLGDGMANENIEKKSKKIAGEGKWCGVIYLKKDADATSLKKDIREKMIPRIGELYWFDNIIHAVDTEEGKKKLLKSLEESF